MRDAAIGPDLGTDGAGQWNWRPPLLAAALVVGIVGRIGYSWSAPFWFDETFSGVIATQPTFARLVQWCLTELTGPAYYMPLWVWEKFAGPSDIALRLPSLILSIATPLLILWNGHRERDLRLLWAILCLLWAPLFSVAGEARPYPQMFALAAAQVVVFVRLLDRPTLGWASGWMILSALLTLTHYWGIVPCFVQGAACVAVHRQRALHTWPALLLSVPLLIWAYWHLPMVLNFTVAGSVQGLPLSALADIPAILFGVAAGGSIILATIFVSTFATIRRARAQPAWTPEAVTALCGIAAVGVVLLLAFVRPGFAPRYALPSMPSALFALALWARWMLRFEPRAVAMVLATMTVTAVGVSLSGYSRPDPRHLFNLEQPSAWLAERPPARLILFWDGPVSARSPASHLDEVGGFFLRRGGHPVSVTVARVSPDQDPNREISTLTRSAPGSAVIWLANDDLPPGRKPMLDQYDRALGCRDFGGGQVTMTACRRRD